MIPPGIHPAEHVVEAQGEPRQGHVVAGQRGGKHPPELSRTEAAVVEIPGEESAVVPVEELSPESRPERHGRRHDDQDD